MADDAGPGPPAACLYTGEGEIPLDAEEVEVDRSVEFIPDRFFQHYHRLESVLLHDGLLKIGKRVFQGCTSLRSFRCPATVTEIGEGTFAGCSNLEVVVLPEGLEEIEEATFWDCTSLREVRIPATVARIGGQAFSGCRNLALIELREGLRWIGLGAFINCTSLGSLHLPSSVEHVGEGAFRQCINLSAVQLQEDLGRIGPRAFGGCTGSFRFVRLLARMEAVALDERTASVFEAKLSKITDAMVGQSDNPWERCKGRLRRAHGVLTYWELKGATTTRELALWRTKIEEEGEAGVIGNDQRMRDVGDVGGLMLDRNINRETWQARGECRVRCGANVVIPGVLKFFSYRTTWTRISFRRDL